MMLHTYDVTYNGLLYAISSTAQIGQVAMLFYGKKLVNGYKELHRA